MPDSSKSQEKRLMVLNELFRGARGYSKSELVDRVGKAVIEGRKQTASVLNGKGISQRSVDSDIAFMRQEYQAPIVCIRGRYKYSNPNFSIKGYLADADEIKDVKDAAALLKSIPGFGSYYELLKVIRKMEMKSEGDEDSERSMIIFDSRPGYSGNKYLIDILSAIREETVISFDYKPFQSDDALHIVLHPYLLKQYNNRWFLVGITEESMRKEHYNIWQFGLERIRGRIKVEPDIKHYYYYKFNPDLYHQDIIGVTLPEDGEIEKVVLKFAESRAPYVETNPLHHSQQLVQDTKTTFSYSLMHNKELEAVILSFGADVEVLNPPVLRKKIAEIYKTAFKIY